MPATETNLNRRFTRTLCICLLLVALVPEARALTPVNLQLRWHHQYQFAGYYAAKEQGYFAEAGLDVAIHAGAPGRESVIEVVEGRAQFGVANTEVLFQRLRYHQPLVALAAIFQHSPSALIALESAHIHNPQDFTNRRIMMLSREDDVELLAMMHNEGLSLDHVQVIKTSYDINDLIRGNTDAFNGYITNEPFYLHEQGIPFAVIKPSRYGIDFYSDILFTHERLLREQPELVRAFRAATLKGWRYALEHPDEMIELIKTRYASPKSRAHLRYEYEQMYQLIRPDLIDLGHMNPGRWQHMADTLVTQGLIEANYDLGGFIFQPGSGYELDRLRGRLWLLSGLIGLFVLLILALLYLNYKLKKNIQRRRTAEAEMLRQKALFEAIFNSLPDAALVTGPGGRIRFTNPRFSRVFGYLPEEMNERPIADLTADIAPDALPWPLDSPHQQAFQRKDGSIFPGEPHSGPVLSRKERALGHIHLIRDISQLKQDQAEITRLAMTDPLTGLANRRKFNEGLGAMLNIASRQQYRLALVAIDLDHFKVVNDRHGHEIGDQLLVQVAAQLRHTFRVSDLIARLGGDEFAVVMIDPEDRHALERPLQRLIERFNDRIVLGNVTVQIGVSFGIALYPDDSLQPEQLMRLADKALYAAKHCGRNCFRYSAEVDAKR